MFVDFPAGFVDIMGCLAKGVTNRIVLPFSADNDPFPRLVGGYCALRTRCGFRCGRACLRKRQWRDQRAGETDNCFLDDNPPFLLLMFYSCFVAHCFYGRGTTRRLDAICEFGDIPYHMMMQ